MSLYVINKIVYTSITPYFESTEMILMELVLSLSECKANKKNNGYHLISNF